MLKWSPGLVVFFLVVSAAHSQTQVNTAADEAAIRQILDARNAAYNRHDAKALAATYAPDADLVTGTGRLVSGRSEIEKNYTEAFAGVDKSASVTINSSTELSSAPHHRCANCSL
jgi:ketosteroid isomerase-like protein